MYDLIRQLEEHARALSALRFRHPELELEITPLYEAAERLIAQARLVSRHVAGEE